MAWRIRPLFAAGPNAADGWLGYRAGKKIEYDGCTGRVTNAPEANAFLRREYRAGWPLVT